MKRRQLLQFGAAAPWGWQAHAQPLAPGAVIDWPVIRLMDGSVLSPASWQGQAAVVVFWATYCAHCRRHNAHIDKLYRATGGQPLRVLGVAQESDLEAVQRYMADNGYAFPVALDRGGLRQRLTTRRVIPMTFTFDRQSRLLQAIPGEMSADDVQGLGRALI